MTTSFGLWPKGLAGPALSSAHGERIDQGQAVDRHEVADIPRGEDETGGQRRARDLGVRLQTLFAASLGQQS